MITVLIKSQFMILKSLCYSYDVAAYLIIYVIKVAYVLYLYDVLVNI